MGPGLARALSTPTKSTCQRWASPSGRRWALAPCEYCIQERRKYSLSLHDCSQVTSYPGSALVVALCVGIWARLRSANLGYTDVGLSYDNLQQRQLWRVVSSQASLCTPEYIITRQYWAMPWASRRIAWCSEMLLQVGECLSSGGVQVSHIDLLHLVFNISSVWSLRRVEAEGTVQFLHCSLLMMLLTAAVNPVCLISYNVFIWFGCT